MSEARNKILAVINQTAKKTEERRNVRKAKGNATGYLTVWNDAVAENFKDEQVAPTMKALALLKRALKRIGTTDVKRNTEFLEWSIRNWQLLGETKFTDRKGRSNYPTAPSLMFFVVAIDRYYSAYCAKDTRPLKSRPSEQTEKQLSRAEAALTIAREEIVLLKEQLEKANAEIKRQEKELRRLAGNKRGGEFRSWD